MVKGAFFILTQLAGVILSDSVVAEPFYPAGHDTYYFVEKGGPTLEVTKALNQGEGTELLAARLKALKSDPALSADEAKLMTELDAQQLKLKTAMIKLNPNLAKYYEDETASPTFQLKRPLSPEASYEISDAQVKVLQSDSSLAEEVQQLKLALKAYRGRLHPAMVKADPKIAPLLAPEPEHFN